MNRNDYRKDEETMSVKPIPDGSENVIPYLTVDDGKGAIEFYKRAFGATERQLDGSRPTAGSRTPRS